PPPAPPAWRVLQPTAPDAARARVMGAYASLPRSTSAGYRVTVAAATCIERVADAVTVHCTESHPDWKAGVVVQPGGRMALLYWLSAWFMRYEWVSLETGDVTRTGEILGAAEPPTVGLDGIAVVPVYGGAELVAVDLMHGSVGRVTPPRGKLVPIAW